MQGKSHALLGAAAWPITEVILELPPLAHPELILVAVFGAMIPDIDHPNSWLGSRCLLLSWPIRKLFGHRGITHSLLIVAAMLWLYQNYGDEQLYFLAFIAGYFSHLIADFLTKGGIPLFYPIKKRFSFPLAITTGTTQEYFITWSIVLITFAYVANQIVPFT